MSSPPDECQIYIALTEQTGYEDAPITTAAGFVIRPDIRNNRRVIIDDFEIAKNLWQRVQTHIPSVLEGGRRLD
jgi:hypothetical protein